MNEVDRCEQFKSGAEELLFHYTTQDGLLGILRERKLWCTHIAYLNDASEYSFTASQYEEALQALSAEQGRDDQMQDYAGDALFFWTGGGHRRPALAWESDVQEYVASFSEAVDDLSQWRAYSSAGSRYAIGFRKEALQRLAARYCMSFEKVQYYDRPSLVTKLKEEFIRSVNEARSGMFPNELDRRNGAPHSGHVGGYGTLSQNLVTRIAPLIKDERFRSEQEWRLVGRATARNSVDFPNRSARPGRSFVVPYVELSFDKLVHEYAIEHPIACIWVGPTPHLDLAAQAVRSTLSNLGWTLGDTTLTPVVCKTEVPYRD